MKVSTDPALIDELLNRAVDTVYPGTDALRELLLSGKRLTVYMGIDPTADYIHLGHSQNYLVLDRFHRLGHKVVVLVGDFTAMIGDPTDKASARVRLTREQVQANLASYRDQIGRILPLDDTGNPIDFRFNSEWLAKLDFEQLTELASSFTVQQMLERDMFQKRIEEQKPLFVHEFFYPLMQGYDSVALRVDVEVGGTDQTFNMLAGRTLVKRYQDREKLVVATGLIANPVTGKKMSKSDGTGVPLNAAPADMFGQVMALPDGFIIPLLTSCTRLPLERIAEHRRRLESGENPKDIKLELALEITRMYHGQDAAADAMTAWITAFSQKGTPDDIPSYKVASGTTIVDALVQHGMASSKTDARRLIEQGAVTDLATGEKVTDPNLPLTKQFVAKVGKHRFSKFEA